jgi:transcriptional regulator with GAF, ATPase, and Fis domain
MDASINKPTREELERDLARKTEEVRLLRQVSCEINSTLDLDRIYEIALRTMADLFGFKHALILLLDPGGKALSVVAARGYGDSCAGAKVDVGVGVIGLVAQKKRILRVGNLSRARAYAQAVREEVKRSGGGAALGAVPRLPGLPDAETQIAIPLLIRDVLVGVFSVECPDKSIFSERDETLASIVGNLAASAIHNAQLYRRVELKAEDQSRELCEVKAKLDGGRGLTFEHLLGESKPMKDVRKLLRKIAASPSSTVLVTGENGTGKDLAAKVIHFNSNRADAPFMNITCSAIADALLESELFGHERGAFTDAKTLKQGLLELADGGTVFLDEIGEMSLVLQAKLLRFLEEKAFRRVGGSKDIKVNVRVVAATNRELRKAVKEGSFREDLYYRLRVLPVELPALRDRSGDLPLLLQFFLSHFRVEFKKNVAGISPEALAELERYPWPGNIRELRNAVERAVLLTEGSRLQVEDFSMLTAAGEGGGGLGLPPEGLSFEDLERDLVRAALERTGWNKTRAARLLGMDRDWLRYRIERYQLKEPASWRE